MLEKRARAHIRKKVFYMSTYYEKKVRDDASVKEGESHLHNKGPSHDASKRCGH